jgi:hypothetical protein
MMAKGTYGWILLATKDLDDTFERLQSYWSDALSRFKRVADDSRATQKR